MTVQMMEIDKEKLIDDGPVWTAADFMKYARDCKIGLFA
jgi:peroxiredoxin family protein